MLRLAILILLLVSVPLAAQTPFENRVNGAIDKGCKALMSRQAPDGSFHGGLGDHGLIVLALLHSKIDKKLPAMRKALRPLRRPASTNYERAVRLMAAELMREPGLRSVVQKDLEDLMHHQASSGGWGYGAASERTDNSCTQYALLGLRAADKLGMQTNRAIWRKALRYLLDQQVRGGGVPYTYGKDPTSSMTAGAISSLVAAMARAGYKDSDTRKGRAKRAIARATTWLAKDWRPGRGAHGFYTLYGLERAMAFSGQDRLGKRDWYKEGAEYLLKLQAADGLWKGSTRSTAFALLFLARASRPTARETPGSVSMLMQSLTGQSRESDVQNVVAKLTKRGKKICSQLAQYLSDPQRARRKAAMLALQRITGKKCGFEPAWSTAENAAAIAAWKKLAASL